MAITVGSLMDTSPFNLMKRTELAERVGRSGNSLLIQMYGDATLRFEMAAGAAGTLSFGAMALFLAWLSGQFAHVQVPSDQSSFWPGLAGATFGLVFSYLSRRTSTEAFEALDLVVTKVEERSQGE